MTKLSTITFAFAIATASMLAGCELYFGGQGDGHGDTKPDPGSNPPGYSCTSNADCAAGCYCADGTCEEGGFCATDSDCPSGYHCDTDRSSCEPDPGCTADTDCAVGQYCDPSTGTCTSSCSCTSDAEAVAGGYQWCDESRMTCMTGEDPNGSCVGAITCTTPPPACSEGQVPLILDGCYTGQCRSISACDAAPACGELVHENDCLGRPTDCSAEYTGHGCHTTTGGSCTSGDAGCTCDSFTFASCEDRGPAARLVRDSANRPVSLSQAQAQ